MSLWIRAITRAAGNTLVWFYSTVCTWSSTYLHSFYSTLSTHFWWFLKAAHLHIHHVAIDVSWKFVCWALVRISNTLILASCLIIGNIAHRMIVFVGSSTNVSVTLTKGSDCCKSFSVGFILVCHKLSSVAAI